MKAFELRYRVCSSLDELEIIQQLVRDTLEHAPHFHLANQLFGGSKRRPQNRHQRKPTWDEKKNPEGRWRVFTYEELVARDKCSLDIFWLKDESLEDSSKLPDPHVLAADIAEDLRSALEQIESVLGDLQQRAAIVEGRKTPRGRLARTVRGIHEADNPT